MIKARFNVDLGPNVEDIISKTNKEEGESKMQMNKMTEIEQYKSNL